MDRAGGLTAALAAAALATAVAASTAFALPTPPPHVPIEHRKIELPDDFQASTPIWTGDGRHLLFSSGGELYLIRQSGEALRCLSCGLPNHPGFEPEPQEAFKDVFPDGKRVLWADFTEAYVLECEPSILDCDRRELLPIDLAAATQPPGAPLALDPGVVHLSPDGVHLGWTASRLDTRAMMVGRLAREDDAYAVRDTRVVNPPSPSGADDTDPRGWTNGGALYELKSFTNGGRSVSYVTSQFEGNPDVYEVDLATGAHRRITGHPDWDEDGGMSPDGNLFALHSDRGMHRVDAAGLLPRRSFIDYTLSANAAIYYVGHTEGFQCDLQPWLFPSGGDVAGRLLGQPLAPYRGGPVHPQNNVPGRGMWNPRSNKIALTEMSYDTALGVDRLLIAKLRRHGTKPDRVVSSEVGEWALTPSQYRGVTDSGLNVTVNGLAAGTADISYSGSIIGGEFSVTYHGYSDDGKSFLDGTEHVTSPELGVIPGTTKADIEMSGKFEGHYRAAASIGRRDGVPEATGEVDAAYRGYELAGEPPQIGPCPEALPGRGKLRIRSRVAHRGGRALIHAKVTGDSAPKIKNAIGQLGDRRPVRHAKVEIAGRRAFTTAAGKARIRLPLGTDGTRRLRVDAGDTFRPEARRIRLGG